MSGAEELLERKAALQAACERGNAEACHGFAEYLQLVDKDEVSALALFRRNCDPPPNALFRRFPASCFSVASLLLLQPGKDRSEALSYLEKSCAGGFFEACHNLAVINRSGMYGRRKDMNAAEEMYSRACEGRVSKSCLGMAVILMNKGEKKRAFGFFERACELGDPYGCSNAHVMCREGDGVAKDLQKAEQLKQTGKSLAAQLGLNVE